MNIVLNHVYDARVKYPSYEPATTKWAVANIQDNWTIFDCGANVGYFTTIFSKCAVNGIIHAFEPTDTINILKKNCEENGCTNIVFHNVAVGTTDGRIEENVYKYWGKNPKPERKEYDFITLDTFYKEQRIPRIDFIKIDVDSFDYDVVVGATKVLTELSPLVLVELNHALHKRNRKPADVINYMKTLNYSIITRMDENCLFKKG